MANQYTSPWTEEMDEFLHESAGTRTLEYMARKLDKTTGAIEKRLRILGIEDKHLLTGTFSAYELANTIGVDPKTVIRWVKEHGLKASQGVFVEKQRVAHFDKHKPYFISVDNFWKWAEENKDRLNWYLFPKQCIPPEPDWVEEQRNIDFFKGVNRRSKWTPEQDERLWNYYYRDGLTQREIASLFGRTQSGVERRLKRLREKKLVSV